MSMNGIDVSSWQLGNIVSLVPHDFAMVKATQGNAFVSKTFTQQIEDALKSGSAAVYHFDNGDTDWRAECDHFLEAIQPYIGRVIVVWDWEASAVQRGTERLRQILSYLTGRLGFPPILYASGSVLKNGGSEVAADNNSGVWCANYPLGYQIIVGYRNDLTPYTACAIHQYTSSGRLSGYNGNLDLNQFFGNKEQWAKYTNGEDGNVQAEQKPAKKSNDEIANEVIAGGWGNGADRRAKLIAQGYDADAIQTLVNQKLGQGAVRTYTVQKRDTLSGIAAKYGTTYQHLADINGIANPNLIHVGQVIKIDGASAKPQTNAQYYTVQRNDNLSTIAKRYGATVNQLVTWNGIKNKNLIYPGQKLRVK